MPDQRETSRSTCKSGADKHFRVFARIRAVRQFKEKQSSTLRRFGEKDFKTTTDYGYADVIFLIYAATPPATRRLKFSANFKLFFLDSVGTNSDDEMFYGTN